MEHPPGFKPTGQLLVIQRRRGSDQPWRDEEEAPGILGGAFEADARRRLDLHRRAQPHLQWQLILRSGYVHDRPLEG